MENDRLWKATLSQPVWGPRSLPSANYYLEEGRPRERWVEVFFLRGPPAYTQQTPLEWDVSSQLQNGYRGGGGGGARTGMWAECSDILDVGRKTKHFAIAENTQSLLIFQTLNTVFSHALRSRLKLIYTSQCFALALEDTESLFLLSEQLTYFNQLTEEHRLCHWENSEGGNPAATDWEQREPEQGRGLTGRTNQRRAKTRRCHAVLNKVY